MTQTNQVLEQMKVQQARTKQSVWIRTMEIVGTHIIEDIVYRVTKTTNPNWHLKNAYYSFTELK